MGAVLTATRPTSSRPRTRAASIQRRGGPEPTDAELIERTSAGDRDAFEELYRRYTRPVLSLALRRLGDPGRAEDALQEAFAAIWRSAASYDRQRGQGGAWLYTIARNAIIDAAAAPAARLRSRRTTRPRTSPARRTAPSAPGSRGASIARSRSCPRTSASVIELAYWRGLSQSEISEA